MPVLTKQADQVCGDQDSMAFEVSGTAAFYRGNWKIAKIPAPYGKDEWQLFDLSVDPGETNDLATKYPNLFQEMRAEYAQYSKSAGVYDFHPGESARKQLIKNNVRHLFFKYIYAIIGFVLAVLAILLGTFWAARSAYRRLSAA